MLKESGWKIVRPQFLIHRRAEKGLQVLVHDGNHAPERANKLYNALILAGIAVQATEVPVTGRFRGTIDWIPRGSYAALVELRHDK